MEENIHNNIDNHKTSYEVNIGIDTLIIVFLIFTIVITLLMPKVYLRSQIYHTSKEINSYQAEYRALKEENRILKLHLEQMRFKNQVTDTLFRFKE